MFLIKKRYFFSVIFLIPFSLSADTYSVNDKLYFGIGGGIISPNEVEIKKHLDNSLMLVTALAPKIGYDNATKIAKNAHKNNTTLKTEAIKSGLVNEVEFTNIVNPKNMI